MGSMINRFLSNRIGPYFSSEMGRDLVTINGSLVLIGNILKEGKKNGGVQKGGRGMENVGRETHVHMNIYMF